MPFANGIFTRLYSWVAENAAGRGILPDRMDADSNDIALGLSNAILRDGTGTPTADIPFGGHKATGLGDPVNAQDAVNLEYLQAHTVAFNTQGGGTAINGQNTFLAIANVQFVAAGLNVFMNGECTFNTAGGNPVEIRMYCDLLDVTTNTVVAQGAEQGCYITTAASHGGQVGATLAFGGVTSGHTYRARILACSTASINSTAAFIQLSGLNV